MADVVTGPTILQQNDNRVVIKIVNQSDGSGGTTVFGDVSAMAARADGTSVAHLALMRVWFACDTGDGGDSYARLDEEDDDGDIPVIGLPEQVIGTLESLVVYQRINHQTLMKVMLILTFQGPLIVATCTKL